MTSEQEFARPHPPVLSRLLDRTILAVAAIAALSTAVLSGLALLSGGGFLFGVVVPVGLIALGSFVVLRLTYVRALRRLLGRFPTGPMATVEPDDLSPLVASDDIGRVAGAFQACLHGLHGELQDLRNTLADRTQAAEDAVAACERAERDAAQRRHIEDVLRRTTIEMTEATEALGQRAEDARSGVAMTEDEVRNIETSISQAMEQVNQVALEVEQGASTMRRLDTDSADITAILSTIKNIANQTNLLALNAAIEAARAGEQGRGFAVVADEVRNLSIHSRNSADQIADLIQRLRTEVKEAVQAIESGSNHAEMTVYHAMTVQEGLSAITDAVSEVRQQTEGVAAAIGSQLDMLRARASEITGTTAV
jgi:methyl-accepting chemotaxis protein